MEKPTLHKIVAPDYLQFIKDTYPPPKTTAGEDYDCKLTYITFEKSFLESADEMELLSEKGFAPLGFLLALRVEMSKALGYGISLDNNSLAKIFYGIHLDTNIPLDKLEEYYKDLLDYGLLFVISDNAGHKALTTPNQLFNFETKEYTRHENARRRRESRKKAKMESLELCPDENEDDSVDEQITSCTPPSEPLDWEASEEDPFGWK